jgi:hypothetical protein
MPRKSKVQKREKLRQLIRGIRKHFMNIGLMKVAGVDHTPLEVVDGLQSLIDQHDRTARAYAQWRQEVGCERLLERKVAVIVRSVERRVLSHFDIDGVKGLADFGMKYNKRGPKTLASKKQMIEKARATRAERRTMGSRQRKKVKGGGG